MYKPAIDHRIIAILAVILIAALARIIPHPPNVTPIAAMALFGGAFLADRRLALILPLAALFVSDLMLGFHATMLFVYAGFILTVFIGMRFLSGKRSPLRIGTAALASSLSFYAITNLGVWAATTMYAHTPQGLMAAYVAGLPFLRNAILGDLFFAAVIFGGFALASYRLPVLRAG